jgi:hypothetical protein
LVAIRMTRSNYAGLVDDLQGQDEQVGFFLAAYEPTQRVFEVHDWRLIGRSGFDYQSPYHVTLTDETKVEVIRWAWDSGASIIEAHSHDGVYPAEFSSSDQLGLREWVPHLFWRLKARPYAAIVTAGYEFDAVAWIEAANRPEQVERIELDDGSTVPATALTLRALERQRAEGWRDR